MSVTPPALEVENLTFRYLRRERPSIEHISFRVEPGEILLLAGASGCGKTTLLRCINGLIPHTYRGEMQGEIRIFGESVRGKSLGEIAQRVGTLLQDPERQILGSYVIQEVAFGLENLGLPRQEILRRAEQALERLGILHLRDRETFLTSGGEKQKITLAGVLALGPRLLLLDEPLASLDPMSAWEALQLFRELAAEGIAIVIVEHRVEDVLAIQPHRVLYLENGRMAYYGDTDGLLQVVDAREIKLPAPEIVRRVAREKTKPQAPVHRPRSRGEALVEFHDVHFRYSNDGRAALRNIRLTIHRGEVIALLGHNGSGKTTLTKHALGLLKPTAGKVLLEGQDTRHLTVAQAAHTVGYVFQSPSHMLFAPTVRQELEFGPKNLGFSPPRIAENVQWAIRTVRLESELETPPLALSFGQQKRVSIAAILSMRSQLLVLDEPTAGQDYSTYRAVMDAMMQMEEVETILFVTHDLDLALCYADRVLLMYDGQIVADGRPEEVLADEERLRACRILPTSLLRLNLEYLPRTGRFLCAEALAQVIGE
jgi:energy-coupling factor transporter ATP-binding protein EcfA2